MMSIKLEMMRCYCAVVRAGNLADAANSLGRTQSAVSMMLKQFENEIGQPLFETDRKNNLTPIGQQIFQTVSQQVNSFDESVRKIEAFAKTPQKILRCASIPSLASLIFPRVLPLFQEQYPQVHIELKDTDSRNVFDLLVCGQVDIGIASGFIQLNHIKADLIVEDEYGLICGKNHPLASHKNRLRLKDISGYNFLQNHLSLGILCGEQNQLLNAKLFVQNTYSLLAMVSLGNYVTILPKTVIGMMSDKVDFYKIHDLKYLRQVYLYQNERTKFVALSQALCETIKHIAAPMFTLPS